MRRQLPALASLVTAAAFAAACGGDGPAATTAPAAANSLIVDVNYIDVIQDCDGIEGDGDFSFTVYARQKNYPDDAIYQVSRTLGPGGRITVGKKQTYSIPGSDGDSFVDVGFEATEWDKNILGATYADSRLDGAYAQVQHTLTNGSWSKMGAQTITLGTPGDCQVRLTYTAYKP